ncbi:hypothetical protein ACI7YT_12570 [Microbacterium sp. M]|uniref:hypothetical protein n=1 Tax=Microbacterium sp. M TaxID=3377125 RepID=UPI003869DEE1
MTRPTRAGQPVLDTTTQKVGITTDAPMARTPRIGVQFIGANYPVLCQLENLTVVEIGLMP